MKKVVIIDLDGVIVDFERGFLESWRKKYPDEYYVSLKNRRNFYIINDYPTQLRDRVKKIYFEPGFFKKLKPMERAVTSLNKISKKFQVFICTSPLGENLGRIHEKIEWVKTNLGNEYLSRLIITKDKTAIRGDYLIDDKPKIKGLLTPVWEHIIFDQPYNRNIKDKKRISWKSWKKILKSLETG